MGELAMDLAAAAAARAKRDLANDTFPLTPAETGKPTPRNAPDAGLLFAKLCRIIENAIALESRLAKGLAPAMPKARPAPVSPAPSLSHAAAALASSTSLATQITPPWQPKPAAPHPAATTQAPAASLNGTAAPRSPG